MICVCVHCATVAVLPLVLMLSDVLISEIDELKINHGFGFVCVCVSGLLLHLLIPYRLLSHLYEHRAHTSHMPDHAQGTLNYSSTKCHCVIFQPHRFKRVKR